MPYLHHPQYVHRNKVEYTEISRENEKRTEVFHQWTKDFAVPANKNVEQAQPNTADDKQI